MAQMKQLVIAIMITVVAVAVIMFGLSMVAHKSGVTSDSVEDGYEKFVDGMKERDKKP
jgi:hypothetical protein